MEFSLYSNVKFSIVSILCIRYGIYLRSSSAGITINTINTRKSLGQKKRKEHGIINILFACLQRHPQTCQAHCRTNT